MYASQPPFVQKIYYFSASMGPQISLSWESVPKRWPRPRSNLKRICARSKMPVFANFAISKPCCRVLYLFQILKIWRSVSHACLVIHTCIVVYVGIVPRLIWDYMFESSSKERGRFVECVERHAWHMDPSETQLCRAPLQRSTPI